eukprot:359971-Chlamydomonas_euryale.AAC.7
MHDAVIAHVAAPRVAPRGKHVEPNKTAVSLLGWRVRSYWKHSFPHLVLEALVSPPRTGSTRFPASNSLVVEDTH